MKRTIMSIAIVGAILVCSNQAQSREVYDNYHQSIRAAIFGFKIAPVAAPAVVKAKPVAKKVVAKKVVKKQPVKKAEAVLDDAAKQKKLEESILQIKDWVRKSCPKKDYLKCLKNNEDINVVVNNDAIVLHTLQLAGKGLKKENLFNPYAAKQKEDIFITVWNTSKDAFDIVIPAFTDEKSCEAVAKLKIADSFGIDNMCKSKEGRFLRVKFH